MMIRADVLIDRVAEAAAASTDWIRRRDERIVAAVAAGLSQREVARAAGLSHTAVQQIVKRAAGESPEP